MGERLMNKLGKEKCKKLKEKIYTNGLIKEREGSLYMNNLNGKLITPKEIFSKNDAIEYLLLAIETFDDKLVGYSNISYEIGEKLDDLFNKVANTKN